ncbi:hypothetical protein HDU67_001158 [Dinochytrium kinnereticum]|nr:hypothetical protein HDU67_001158 [Dinochytrium kinnereticum]
MATTSAGGGEGPEFEDTTLAALLSAFVINGALAILFLTGFVLLRPRFPQTYAPRVSSVPEKQRSPALPATMFGFFEAFKTSELSLLTRLGPDAYATIYFTRTLALLFIGLGLFSSIVLLPVHIYGGNNLLGLNALTFGNVTSTNLLWVHLVVMAVVTVATIHTIYKMIAVTARLRQHYQSSSEMARSINARTLLIRDVPSDIRKPLELARLFDRISPGSVHTVVIPRRVSGELTKLVLKRTWKQHRLEEVLTKYISASAEEAHAGHHPQANSRCFEDAVENARSLSRSVSTNGNGYHESRALEGGIHQDKNRPVHKKFYFFGESKDAITYYSDQLKVLQDRIEIIQDARGILDVSEVITAPPSASLAESPAVIQESHVLSVDATDAQFMPIAFVFFNNIVSTHVAAAATVHDTPAGLSEKFPCVDVDDVLWENAQTTFLERQSRASFAYSCYIALIVSWSAIIGFIRTFSEPAALSRIFPVLKPFFDYSPQLTGVVTGFLPQAAISILLLLVPVLLRVLNRVAGVALLTEVERITHEQFFLFQVFNLFFAVTISGTILSIWSIFGAILKDPSYIFFALAEIIPKSANFFTNYVMLAGLSGPAVDILQLAPLVASPFLVYFFGSTPRAIHSVLQPIPFRYSEIVAYHSFFAVLGLIYLTIAPLVVVMVSLYFSFYFFVYMYQLQYVYVHPFESGGKLLLTASRHLFVGLYIMQILMIGLFGLRQAYIQAGLTLILLALTSWSTHQTNRFERLINELPVKTALDAEDAEALSGQQGPQYKRPETLLSRFLPGFLNAAEMPDELQGLMVRERELRAPFAFPGKDELVEMFAHPNAGAPAIKIWVPATSMEEIAETVRMDVAKIPDSVLVTEGAAVDSEGHVKLSPEAIAWEDV